MPGWRDRSLYNPLEFEAVDHEWESVVVRREHVVLGTTVGRRVTARPDDLKLGNRRFEFAPMEDYGVEPINPVFCLTN